tara:strand:+ start:4199 stop:4546 length:348 start_codon:yes stop_codon:yes gene_type:complete
MVVTGCANSVNYYHSERFSLTMEAKASDPQAPVQGNLGIKTRTVLVTPGKNSHGYAALPGTGPGDSVSVVSYFDLDRDPDDASSAATTTIKSAFITGSAAKKVTANAMKSIAGVD